MEWKSILYWSSTYNPALDEDEDYAEEGEEEKDLYSAGTSKHFDFGAALKVWNHPGDRIRTISVNVKICLWPLHATPVELQSHGDPGEGLNWLVHGPYGRLQWARADP